MFYFLRPRKVGIVNQTLDVRIDFGKGSEIGEVGHRRFHLRAFAIALRQADPWVRQRLLQAQ